MYYVYSAYSLRGQLLKSYLSKPFKNIFFNKLWTFLLEVKLKISTWIKTPQESLRYYKPKFVSLFVNKHCWLLLFYFLEE